MQTTTKLSVIVNVNVIAQKNGTSNNVKKDKNRYCLLRYGQMSKTAKSMATILIENMAGKH